MLRSKTPHLVRQEFYALWLVHFAIRRLMHEAALKNDIDPDRLSFKTSLQIVRVKCSSSRGKRNPRVVKRRTSYYPSRKGDEPLNVRLHITIRVRFSTN